MKYCTLLLFIALAIFGSNANVQRIKTSNHVSTKKILDKSLLKDFGEDDWWQKAVFYQIYPRSYKDSNNDGIGDLQGIISKLNHLADAGITATWLSPIFKSPQVDQGYDISDYRDIEPDYGTLDDLKELVEKAHALGIKIILDFVPNHTSDQHEWFQNSVNKVEGFEDFYIWSDGKVDDDGNRIPPNNWISLFKGSAWTWNEDRQQYYFHQFVPAQPDLNYRNPAVVAAMKDVLKYWLDFGVDGFRVDAVPHIFEVKDLADEPESEIPGYTSNDYEFLDHIYTKDQDETFEMIYDWRDFLDAYTNENGGDTRVMMTESYTTFENTVRYYGVADNNGTVRLGAHFSFNFNLITNVNENSTAFDIEDTIGEWMYAPDFVTYNWVLGNHDNHRVATRLGVSNIDGFNMLVAFLRGIQVTYNGEEIGQENGEVTCSEGQDPSAIQNCSTFDQISRDFERTPFQWDTSINAGFNDGAKPWLPVSEKANETNLELQNVDGLNSHYNIYKELMSVRKAIQAADANPDVAIIVFDVGANIQNKFYSERTYEDEDGNILNQFILLFNIGNEALNISHIDGNYTVLVASKDSQYSVGDIVDLGNIVLEGHEAIICSS